MKLLLSGHAWTAYSPSMYALDSHPVWLTFNGRHWYLAFNGEYRGSKPWPSRDSAASAIAAAFQEHAEASA